MFRHSYIYINNKSGIKSPADLNGRRVGLQTWFTSAAIWARGALEDDWGVDIRSITWVAQREVSIGGWKPPSWLKLEFVPKGQEQFDLLALGDIQGALTTRLWAPKNPPQYRLSFSQPWRGRARLLHSDGVFSHHAYPAHQNRAPGKGAVGRHEFVRRLDGIEAGPLR